jgi:hypothetical protein
MRRLNLEKDSLMPALVPTADETETNNGLTIVVPELCPPIGPLAAEALLQVLLAAAHARCVSLTPQPPAQRHAKEE